VSKEDEISKSIAIEKEGYFASFNGDPNVPTTTGDFCCLPQYSNEEGGEA
jgi:hypothetical protein